MMITRITAALLLITSTLVLAEETDTPVLKEYDVEVIIFEDAHARYINSQTWDYQNPAKATDGDETVVDDLDKLSLDEIKAFDITQRSPSILKTEYGRLKRSSEYNILLYAAWRQAGLGADKAFDIDIAELTNNHKSKSTSLLNGTLKVVLKRYLHFYAKLDYQRETTFTIEQESPTSDEPATGEPLPVTETVTRLMHYPINAHRRMRSKELHYIDHPLVGILIQINPVEQPKKKDE